MSVYGVMLEIYKRLLNECLRCDARELQKIVK